MVLNPTMNSVGFHVMDGLSSVRQPVSGFAGALFGNVGERPWAGFRLLAAAHAPIWTIRPSALYPNRPLDLEHGFARPYGRLRSIPQLRDQQSAGQVGSIPYDRHRPILPTLRVVGHLTTSRCLIELP